MKFVRISKDDEIDDFDDEVQDNGDDIIVLEDEEGKSSRFRILFDSLFVEENQYVVLMPLEEEDLPEPEIVILKLEDTGDGQGVLVTIDEDEEWEKVLKAFEDIDIDDGLGDFEIQVDDGSFLGDSKKRQD